MAKVERNRFWLVWCPEKSVPTTKHHTREAADLEAERLSEMNPGLDYFVLKAVGGSVSEKPKLAHMKFVAAEACYEPPF